MIYQITTAKKVLETSLMLLKFFLQGTTASQSFATGALVAARTTVKHLQGAQVQLT